MTEGVVVVVVVVLCKTLLIGPEADGCAKYYLQFYLVMITVGGEKRRNHT